LGRIISSVALRPLKGSSQVVAVLFDRRIQEHIAVVADQIERANAVVIASDDARISKLYS
jgi:hypothetical protein